MQTDATQSVDMPVVRHPRDFDRHSGSVLERIVFNYRPIFIGICAILTLLLGFQATKLVINAGFDKIIPQDHPYIKNYFANRDKLGGLGNVVRVVVENVDGDIFDPKFLEATKQINEALFLLPGADRAWMKSIWMSSVRWIEVTEEGFRGGGVMPDDFDGSPRTIEKLKTQVRMAGIVGSLVSSDFKSIMIVVPLLEKDPETGQRLDYGAFSNRLETTVRQKYEFARGVEQVARAHETAYVRVRIIGFAKLVGDLIDGLQKVMTYFSIAAAVAAAIIFLYTRDIRSTALVVLCSLVAVVWQLGIVATMRYELDPYSILVPFLVFAIGVSHGAQKMNGIMQDVARGTHKYIAARYTFRRLFLAGLTALIADAVGFAVLMFIDIPVIKDLAITASIGVAVLIFTNLLLLPVALSYVGVSDSASKRSLVEENKELRGRGIGAVWDALDRFTTRRWATAAIVVYLALAVGGYLVSLKLQTGDLDPGAPELRADSRYNQDLAYINANYRLSSDQFIAMVKTRDEGCADYRTLKQTEKLTWALREVPGVRSVTSLADNLSTVASGLNEANPKWLSVPRNKALIGSATQLMITDYPEAVDKNCSTIPIVAYLADHKAQTLQRVVATVERFAADNDDPDIKFLLAAGPAGIESVTNIVVERASRTMLLYVYAAVILLCWVTFRSWRAVAVAVIPLIITSILCEALMVLLGMGIKVATLPVIALGVGIGVDYALYLLSVQLSNQRAGMSLPLAYKRAVAFTGKVVALVGITLSAGVVTWAWSPIKFQADMGILLTFMFMFNMLGALVLIPSLSYFMLRR
ncbi:MAG: MMPL family transporter [Gemmatimonadota bacterium]|nr:MMPL family transporter [Gemmatimonadota bacterium]